MAYCANCGTVEQPEQQFCPTCGAATSGPFAPPAPLPYFPIDEAPKEPDLAGFWWRVLGFVIDSIILALVTTLPARSMSVNFYVEVIGTLVIGFLYWFLFITYWNGQTIGMKVASVRCVNMEGRGQVGLRQSAVRSLAYSILLAVGSFYHYTTYVNPTPAETRQEGVHVAVAFCLFIPHFLDLLWVAWDKKNQTLHDKVAGTLVVRDDKVLAQNPAPPDIGGSL